MGRGSSYYAERPSDGAFMGSRSNVAMLFAPTSLQFCWPTLVCPAAFIVALPVDLTLDVVLLPYDIARR
ncbi:YceK/YidQ family lipoprotein [Pseudomonas sp. SBB6]|uniref:YceK/YidQ family lipoprotein n=1 Tax=Pseudomonas sp. SBB6 TaxID=2962032 RepID=UPI0020B6BF60|nr:YceK/YidQ family lipoprotein [Pseudomonas sp. SBB6]MCP3751540.1 YceK/YidQ family lipoprotein [Pseudomonas sp. SBB6]